MKNIILLTFATILCTCLKAQTWNPEGDNTTTGNVMGKNLLVYKGITNVLDIGNIRQTGLYRIQNNGYSNALLDISGISGSTPRFQILANYSDRLYFRAARDSENNWDSKGFREILTASDDGAIDFGDRKFIAKNLLIDRGGINLIDINKTRETGFYKLTCQGYSDALIDISGFDGSTPRIQLRANYADKLYFRAARDSENNWDSKGFREILTASDDGAIDFGDRKFIAKNLLIDRGGINLIDINKTRETGFYKLTCQGYSDALIDISGFAGSTPRIQLRANYADKLYFRASRDSESNWDNKKFREVIMANESGNVGIGTQNTGNYKLAVNGSICAKEVRVETDWADFVFEDNYKLRDLKDVESFIEENKHLPDIPSEKEVKEKGVNLGDMDAKLLQKIEELTLYVIQLSKENNEFRERLKKLETDK